MKTPALLFMLALGLASTAHAEVKTITATGEYRMGDNDTKTDAKRLALQDGKRLALEKAGIYLESITEVKKFVLSRDEIRAYTAGIVEVIEQQTRSNMEGETTVVRVDVTCKIDTAVVTRQIDVLRKNERAKDDLLHAQTEAEQLRVENEVLRQKLAATTSPEAIASILEQRREILARQDVNGLLTQAWVALTGSENVTLQPGSSSAAGRIRARKLMNEAVAVAPLDPSVHRRMGDLLQDEGNIEGAEAEYREALRLDPNDPDAHHNFGILLKTKGDWNAAVTEQRAAQRLRPNHWIYNASLGDALQLAGRLEEAIAAYRTALRLQSGIALTHTNLGAALQAKGDLDAAVAEYRTALRLKPDADTYTRLGTVLYHKGELDEALANWRTVLRLTPNDAGAHLNVGIALQTKGDLAGAINAYHSALRLKPDDANIYINLGNALQINGDLDGAIEAYHTGLRLKPSHAEAHYNLGLALKTKGESKEALRLFREYLRLQPDTPINRPYIEKVRQILRELE